MPEPCAAWKTSDGRVFTSEVLARDWERRGKLIDLIQNKIGLPTNLYSGEIGPFTDWLLVHWDSLREIFTTPDLNDMGASSDNK